MPFQQPLFLGINFLGQGVELLLRLGQGPIFRCLDDTDNLVVWRDHVELVYKCVDVFNVNLCLDPKIGTGSTIDPPSFTAIGVK